jgi:hypothetical protein
MGIAEDAVAHAVYDGLMAPDELREGAPVAALRLGYKLIVRQLRLFVQVRAYLRCAPPGPVPSTGEGRGGTL